MSENEAGCENKEDVVKKELADSFDTTGGTLVTMNGMNPQLTTNNEMLLQIEQIIEKNEGLWECKVCGKTTPRRSYIQNHAEIHLEGMSHVCHICSKTFSTSQNMKSHISKIHSELFSCDICEKSGMNRAGYRDHKRKYHKTMSGKQ